MYITSCCGCFLYYFRADQRYLL